MSQQSVGSGAPISLTWRINLLLTLVASIARWSGAGLVVALVDLGVGITKLDSNIADQLVLEADSLDTGNSLDHGGLSVSDMANRSNVDGRLAGDNFGS